MFWNLQIYLIKIKKYRFHLKHYIILDLFLSQSIGTVSSSEVVEDISIRIKFLHFYRFRCLTPD